MRWARPLAALSLWGEAFAFDASTLGRQLPVNAFLDALHRCSHCWVSSLRVAISGIRWSRQCRGRARS
jgi:hypothetical protein